MPNLDLAILIVDDARFSSTIIAKTLARAGYRDLRIANDAHTALDMMEQRKAGLLIADWLMPEMDGLELSQRVRQLDEQSNHFTYIIVLTAKESPEALVEAFEKGVDDFIFKSDMAKQLLPRVYAADRLTDRHNAMLIANQLLLENNRHLENRNILDIETGVGNERYAQDSLSKMLKHTEARGGATSYMLINIRNWPELEQQHNHLICEELAVGITRRLRTLIRPLDVLCRINPQQYAIIAHFGDIEHCTINSYKRVFDGINLKSFRSSAGYISVTAVAAVCTVDENSPVPEVMDVEQTAQELVLQAMETDTLPISRWEADQTSTG